MITDVFSMAKTPEEKLLAKKASDKAARALRTCKTENMKFLTPAEAAFLGAFCARAGIRAVFDGGYAGAERKIALFPPEWQDTAEPDAWIPEESPVCALHVKAGGGMELSHRDCLGALMAAGIKRETIGDICVCGGECWVFCLSEIAEYIIQNVKTASRAKVVILRVSRDEVPAPDSDGEELNVTVPSMRLDSVAAAGFRLSREEAKESILRGLCSVGHIPEEKPDAQVGQGDLISFRGRGRLRIESVNGQTRKGRISLTLVKFGR